MSCPVTRLTCHGCGRSGVEMLVRTDRGKNPAAFRCLDCLEDMARTGSPRPIGSAAGR